MPRPDAGGFEDLLGKASHPDHATPAPAEPAPISPLLPASAVPLPALVDPGARHDRSPLDVPFTGSGSSGRQGAAPPPVLGHPPGPASEPGTLPRNPDADRARARRQRAERLQAELDRLHPDDGPATPGVNPGRLLETLMELARITAPPLREAAVARYVRERLRRIEVTAREVGACGNLVAELSDPAGKPPLWMVCHMDAEDAGPDASPEWTGSMLRCNRRPAGLHGRAGVALLLEVLTVAAERTAAGSPPAASLHAVFAVDGEGQGSGAHALDLPDRSRGALFLDGFLADEIIEPLPPRTGPTGRTARAARVEAERTMLAGAGRESPGPGGWSTRPPPPGEAMPPAPALIPLRRRLEHHLARVGIPAWSGRFPPEASGASHFVAHGVPALVVGTGVLGAHQPGESFVLSDGVLCARLLYAILTDSG